MSFPKGARAGLLLFLTAGPFLVFLFLHLFGKNHFEPDRYGLRLSEVLEKPETNSRPVIILDTNLISTGCNQGSLLAQLQRIRVFGEDLEIKPQCRYTNSSTPNALLPSGLEWFLQEKTVPVKSARSEGKKKLPNPPRAMLFDQNQNLRGVYGLCDNKSVDTLMLEYRILVAP